MVKTKLTQDQQPHLPTVHWLLFGPRKSGRTHLLAYAYAMHAMGRPGERITIADHDPHRDAIRGLLAEIDAIFYAEGWHETHTLTAGADWIRVTRGGAS